MATTRISILFCDDAEPLPRTTWWGGSPMGWRAYWAGPIRQDVRLDAEPMKSPDRQDGAGKSPSTRPWSSRELVRTGKRRSSPALRAVVGTLRRRRRTFRQALRDWRPADSPELQSRASLKIGENSSGACTKREFPSSPETPTVPNGMVAASSHSTSRQGLQRRRSAGQCDHSRQHPPWSARTLARALFAVGKGR